MPKKKRTLTPEKVIQIAIQQANASDLANVTLASIAKELNIRVPSLYNHIAGLDGLHQEIRLSGLKQLAEFIKLAAIGKSGDEALQNIARAYRNFAHENPGIYSVMLNAPASDETEIIAVSQQIIDVIITVLDAYALNKEDVLHYVRAFRSVLHGFVDLEVRGGFALNIARDESFEHLIQVFVQGLPQN